MVDIVIHIILMIVMLLLMAQKSHRPRETKERERRGLCKMLSQKRQLCLCSERASEVRTCPQETQESPPLSLSNLPLGLLHFCFLTCYTPSELFCRMVWACLFMLNSQESNSKYAALFKRSVETGIIERIVLFSERIAFSLVFIHQGMNTI